MSESKSGLDEWRETRTVTVADLTFDVATAGPDYGAPVMLLHGFPESNAQWRSVAAQLADAGHRVIAPNLRGYSPAARPQGAENYSIDELVGDVIGLFDALDIERAHLVGHDWGGTIGWFAAIRHPERFATYTAVSTAHPKAMLDAIATDESQRDAMQYIKTFREPDATELLMADDWRRLREGCHDLPRATFDEHARRLAEPGALDAALNYYRAYGPRDAADLGPCTIPTTYVWGADDFAFGRTAAHLTHAYVDAPYRLVELENTGHWISDLHPEPLAAAILERIDEAHGR